MCQARKNSRQGRATRGAVGVGVVAGAVVAVEVVVGVVVAAAVKILVATVMALATSGVGVSGEPSLKQIVRPRKIVA